MKKRMFLGKSVRLGLGLLLTAGFVLSGCGASSSKGSGNEMAMAEEVMETAAYDEYAYDNGLYVTEKAEEAPAEEAGTTEANPSETTGGEISEDTARQTDRKLIRNVAVRAETESFDTLIPAVEEKVKLLGGYVETSYVYQGSRYYEDLRHANYTLRVPAEKLDEFLSQVGEISNITSKDESVTDVTLQYVDLESHKEALLTEQDRLLELLGKAENIEDIITIETRLSEVRYQIESMEARLRTMDNQVFYSTVNLYIDEVKRLSPVAEQTAWEKIGTGFMASIYDIGEGIQNFFIGLLVNLPYILVAAVIIVVIFLLLRLIKNKLFQWADKDREKQSIKREKEKQRKQEQETAEKETGPETENKEQEEGKEKQNE